MEKCAVRPPTFDRLGFVPLSLRPATDLLVAPRGAWTCTSCGVHHQVKTSQAVTVRGRGGNELTIFLCPACAHEVMESLG